MKSILTDPCLPNTQTHHPMPQALYCLSPVDSRNQVVCQKHSKLDLLTHDDHVGADALAGDKWEPKCWDQGNLEESVLNLRPFWYYSPA